MGMAPPNKLTGRRFGNLTVIGQSSTPSKNLRWHCCCDCGEIIEARGDALKSGGVTSCGCFGRERHRKAVTKHGMTMTPTWISWRNMLARCGYVRDKKFYAYGARGITVCKRWSRFENFLADMGKRPPKTTLDRIDGTRGYYPENCRWADVFVQRHNRIIPTQD
jgi:hypothetical protein